jgi:formylglycine-generating enzyme required for sulfatase activity
MPNKTDKRLFPPSEYPPPIIFFLASLALFFSFFPLFPTHAQPLQNGLLFVYPDPDDAQVKILEPNRDYSPGLSLEPGAYVVQVEKPGYETYEKKIYIESRELFDLFVELEKSTQWTDPETGMEFVWIPSGCFEMGCGQWAGECEPDEKPVHHVCLDGFWIGKYEVTQKVWEKIMGNNPSSFQKGDNYPVEHVSWKQAQEFIKKLKIDGGYTPRLPSEAEWEYAARGGGRMELYAGGNDISIFGWYENNSEQSTQPVGKKMPNAYGLHDMSGNVWEWCEDIYLQDAYGTSPENNPSDADISVFRIRRGGSWDSEPRHLRSLFRGRYPSDLQFESNGIRVVLEAD